MKKAFTMIEIIFAIVIIGILGAIAIPKISGNKQDAEIVKLKETISNVRKSIEAYAGDSIIIKGVKQYPKGLCNFNRCNERDVLFENLSSITYPHQKLKIKDNYEFVFWTNDTIQTYLIMKKNTKKGYMFRYNNVDGTLNCIKENKDGYEGLDCGILKD